jgi:UTP--glucose-1-phosphate uridylyltransferase
MAQITKAIILVAGWGTRRLPITKVIEKCMLPVGNRPIIDYIVEDFRKAGINEICFVTSPNMTQLKKYYSDNDTLEQFLIYNNKSAMLPLVRSPEGISFKYVIQPKQDGMLSALGVAIEVLGADEPAVVFSGDDILYRSDGGSDLAELIESLSDGESGMLAGEVDRSEVGRYGVLTIENGYLKGFVEKPKPEEAPSNLINLVKWVFQPSILKEIYHDYQNDRPVKGEEHHYVEALLRRLDAGDELKVQRIKGEYLDCGSFDGWLHANEVVGKDLNRR